MWKNTSQNQQNMYEVNVVLLIMTKDYRQVMCPPRDWLNESWQIHIMQFPAAVRKIVTKMYLY